jgi:hypothetical protein
MTGLRINKAYEIRRGDKMDCRGLKRMRAIASLGFIFYFMTLGLTFAQTAEDYFQQGKGALEDLDLLTSHTHFQSALALDPNHQGANLFYAITRILMVSQSTAFNNLLNRAGMSSSGRDIFDWTADFRRDPSGEILLPSNSPTGAELQAFLKNSIVPEIDGALANLSKVTSTHQTIFRWMIETGSGVVSSPNTLTGMAQAWAPDEWIGNKLIINGTEYTITGNTTNTILVNPNWTIPSGTYDYGIFEEVEVDYGDVLVLKGSLFLAKAGILILNSYNFAIDIDKIVSLYNAVKLDIQKNIIKAYKNFLNLLPDQKLSQAKELLRNGISIFAEAIDFIVGETDPQDNDLFVIDDPAAKQEYRDLLTDLNSALDQTALIRGLGLDVNLSELFDDPKNLRDYLPTFLGSGYIKRDSFPDATFGGILPSMTSSELQQGFKELIRDSYSLSPVGLYDNFSKNYIDQNKWRQGEWVREIRGGKLILEQTTPHPAAIASYPFNETNWLSFPNPNSVDSLQADVIIHESTLTNSATTRASVAGFWYSDGSSEQGSTGDIVASIDLRGGPTGLTATWGIFKFTNPEATTLQSLGSGNFSTPVALGTTFTLYISYDSVNNQFRFRIGDEEITFGPTGLPDRVRNPNRPMRGIGTRIQINDASSAGTIATTFDNVYKNGVLYDDFSSSMIEAAKWTSYEFTREISGGKLRSTIRSSSASTSSINNRLEFLYPSEINVIQTKVTPLAYQNNQGANIVARAGGFFFNDGTQGGGLTGNIGAHVRIGGTELNPVCGWDVWRILDSQGNVVELIDSGTFNTPISLGKSYTLYLGWDGIQFIFKIGKETAYYKPKGITNPLVSHWKEIGMRILPPSGKEASMIALFDDVKIHSVSDIK